MCTPLANGIYDYMFESGVVGKKSFYFFFVIVSSWSRCSFKHLSIFVISLNSNCRHAGTCLHVNNSYLGCQPHLTKELPHVSGGTGVNMSLCCRPYLTIPTKIRPPRRTNSGWHRKRGRWSKKRGMTAQMYNSFIHHPSLFSSHHSEPTKNQPALAFSVFANVICRSVTEMVRERKEAFSPWI